jgi:lysophospholipase L1-like esterase
MKQLCTALLLISLLLTFQPSKCQTNKLNLDIVYIGNSITQGSQQAEQAGETPPAYSTKHIRTLKGVESAVYLNRGKSGYTTVNFLPAANGELTKVIEATVSFHTDKTRLLVFSISLGTNDSAEEGPKGSPLWPEEYHTNIKAITDKLLEEFPGCRVVYQQPIWYSETTYNRAKYLKAGLERLQTYFPELKSLAEEYSRTKPGQDSWVIPGHLTILRRTTLQTLFPNREMQVLSIFIPTKKDQKHWEGSGERGFTRLLEVSRKW